MKTSATNVSGAEDLPLLETRMTFLQMLSPPAAFPAEERDDVYLERKRNPDVDEYVSLFRAIGQHWLWQKRLTHTREEIAEIISRPSTELHILYAKDAREPAGLLELDSSDPANINLVYFGLRNEFIGKHLGGFLMKSALRIVWRRTPAPYRFWFTTCTFDHPGALGFYQHMGFSVYRTDIPDRFPDPRCNPYLYGGPYSLNCAPHVPLGRPDRPSDRADGERGGP
jgi:hypothetical protein